MRRPGGTDAAGRTKSVMLWAGTELLIVFALTATSESRLIVLAAVSCHTCAVPAPGEFVSAMLIGLLPLNTLLTTMTVNAPSEERTAPNAERLSGFGTVAATPVS